MLVTHGSRLLSPAEVAIRLGVHPASVRRWIAAGQLDAVRLGAGELARIRVTPSAVERFVRSTAQGQP